MKTLPSNILSEYNQSNNTIIYTRALIKFPNVNGYVELEPQNFRATNNSYTQNGGNDFPIGCAISKSITIEIDNTDEQYNEYDWDNAEIHLYSKFVIRDFKSEYDLFEGIFYVMDIELHPQSLVITANDFMIKTEIPTQFVNAVSGGKQYDTVWEYFAGEDGDGGKGVCKEIAVAVYGSGHDGTEVYASHLATDGFSNSTKRLSYIAGTDRNDDITLRDALGFIAQIAGGNAVIVYEQVNGEYVPKIDIKEYDFSFLTSSYIDCKRVTQTVEDIIDCGDFSQTVEDIIDCGTSTDSEYILLDKFINNPTIQFSDVGYTNVKLSFPVTGSDKYSSKYAYTAGYSNVLELTNPILIYNNTASDKQQVEEDLQAIVYSLGNKLCLIYNDYYIRPFSGNYTSQPLLEFMDNVIVMDRKGNVYNSFVTAITYNYLGETEIENNVPTVARNNQVYYSNY